MINKFQVMKLHCTCRLTVLSVLYLQSLWLVYVHMENMVLHLNG